MTLKGNKLSLSEVWLHDHLIIEFVIIVSKNLKKTSAYVKFIYYMFPSCTSPDPVNEREDFWKNGINNREIWKFRKKGIHVIGRNHLEKRCLL